MAVAPAIEEARVYEGRRVGRYTLRYRVARGGMGSVYLADLQGPAGFGKWVAVKLLHPYLAEDAGLVRMFQDEARIACTIDHPDVCQVLDFGQEPDGLLYLVMEYLHGTTFAAVLKRGAGTEGVPPWLCARVIADAARGLHAAHEATDARGRPLGLVHRDIAPQNLYVLHDGPTKVLDFGIARVRDRASETRDGVLRGRLAYMSPEQVGAAPIDRRSDVWSLGVTLWEGLAGQRLFRRDTEPETMRAVLEAELADPAATRPGCPRGLAAIAMRALHRSPAERWPSAAALADAIDAWLHESRERGDHARVSEWMRAQFAAEIAERTALLRSAPPDRGTVPDVRAPEAADPTTTSRDPQEPAHAAAGETRSGVTVSQRHARLRVRRAGVAVAAVGAIALAAIGGWWWSTRGPIETGGVALPLPPRAAPPEARPPAPAGGEVTVAPVPPPPVDDDPQAPAAGEVLPEDPTPQRPGDRGAAPRENGRLNLLVIPEVDVFEGSRRLGRTPLSREMRAGRHRLRLVPERGAPQTITVEIAPRQTTRSSLRL